MDRPRKAKGGKRVASAREHTSRRAAVRPSAKQKTSASASRRRHAPGGQPYHPTLPHLLLAISTLAVGLLGLDILVADSVAVTFLTTDICFERWTVLSRAVRLGMTCSITLNVAQLMVWLHGLHR